MEALQKNKGIVITVIVLLILVIGGVMLTRGGDGDSADNNNNDSVLPDVEVLPTVDPSVIVSLEPDALGQEVLLTVEDYPDGTDSIEYELSYDATVDGESVPKGVIGSIDVAKEGKASKSITLGTCSSGVCKYDQGIETIKLTLRFVGDYGAQLFEGDFEM